MISPFRSASRLALSAVVIAGGLIASAQPARAQEGESLIRDTEIEEILHQDADPIFAAAGINPKDVQIMLIGSKDLNAFAAPKVMGVNTALILQAKNPNELQGVMAHEVGHLAGGHSFRSGDYQRAGETRRSFGIERGTVGRIGEARDAPVAIVSSPHPLTRPGSRDVKPQAVSQGRPRHRIVFIKCDGSSPTAALDERPVDGVVWVIFKSPVLNKFGIESTVNGMADVFDHQAIESRADFDAGPVNMDGQVSGRGLSPEGERCQ